MNIQEKEEAVAKEKKLYVGYGVVEILAINPDRDELCDLLGVTEPESKAKFKEPEYTKEDEEGNSISKIQIYVKSVKTGEVNSILFQLTDKERISKDGTKSMYVNQLGDSQYASNTDNWNREENPGGLFSSFKAFTQITWLLPDGTTSDRWKPGAIVYSEKIIQKKEYRKAVEGEDNLYALINGIFNLDKYNPSVSIILDTKKLFKGNFKQLNDNLLGKKVICCYAVRTKEDGTEIQTISNKFFISALSYSPLVNYNLTPGKIEIIRDKAMDKKKLTPVETFFNNTTDPSNGIKHFYNPIPLEDYDPSKNFLNSGSVIQETTIEDDLPF
jgi:hypothetical protein